jgi:hypothetical protein
MRTTSILVTLGLALAAAPLMIGQAARSEPLNITPPDLASSEIQAPTTTATTTVRYRPRAAKRAIPPAAKAATATHDATDSDSDVPKDAAHRSAENVELLATLPWWRSDKMQTVHYLDKAVASQVLTAADIWLGAFPDPIREAEDNGSRVSPSHKNPSHKLESGADRAVAESPSATTASSKAPSFATAAARTALPVDDESTGMSTAESDTHATVVTEPAGDKPPVDENAWIKSVLALLGGAVAAASTARFLFI